MMKHLVQLDPDEEVVGMVRKSPWSQVWVGLLAVAWVLIPFFFFFPLLVLGLFGITFFLAFEITGVAFAVRAWKRWHNTMLIITDQRVIDVDQLGFFAREVAELRYEEIGGISTSQKGFARKLLGLGEVRVQSVKSLSYDFAFSGVKHPKNVADLIDEVQYFLTKQESDSSVHVAKKKRS